MATGIMAAVPIVFKPSERFGINEEYFVKGFFDNYDISGDNGSKIYIIKQNLLLNNYITFLAEFYDLIEEDFYKKTEIAPDIIPAANTLKEFNEAFTGDSRNNRIPFIYESPYMFSTLGGCVCEEYWLFYSGSHKAILEEYSTLLHLERLLTKAMKSPLANAVKFGIFG